MRRAPAGGDGDLAVVVQSVNVLRPSRSRRQETEPKDVSAPVSASGFMLLDLLDL